MKRRYLWTTKRSIKSFNDKPVKAYSLSPYTMFSGSSPLFQRKFFSTPTARTLKSPEKINQ